MITRRSFIKSSALLTAASLINPTAMFAQKGKSTRMGGNGKMQLTFRPFDAILKHPFTISGYTRTTTPIVLTQVTYDGITGYGEAAMPPYLGESQASVMAFLQKVNLQQFSNPFELDDILAYVDDIAINNTAAKASVDIALHDLVGKLMGQPWHAIWGYTAAKAPVTTFTIGIDTEAVVKQKTLEAAPYKVLKVKLGVDEVTDKMLINTIRSVTNKPIRVDANQGWKDKHYALKMIEWLSERNVEFVEQPMPKHDLDDMAWLTEQSPLPTIADESCQRLEDIPRLKDVFNGINIKLMKCTGMREANKMISMAETFGMKLMIGCMTETSCAISAAAQLAPKMDYADLDGNLLLANDCFTGMKVIDGKITLSNQPGIGAKPLNV
ncbi:dipeptide epimerase [Microbacter margulisiae]|uniref:Dipeptide epimerase n=1 Tax=Microbacter margulisiae TaxID=1350067 RepID=A0A7W5DSE1_9PORP|nr:dipeptide epimerase [Microbacter margulisiae]MBB3188201.1 L-alanine-DL-glutamate epimerase-like enolase superfamily enzyme [Microbacter margulisiae]